MESRVPDRKLELIERVAALAAQRLPRERAEPAARFIRSFYANVALDDLIERAVDDLYGAAMAIWTFARRRTPGEPKIRVYVPDRGEHGWHCPHGVVEIVNDDMPFLVDSVTQYFAQRETTVHLVIHPVLRVERDDKGEVTGIAETGAAGALRESIMHVEIDEQRDPALREAIAEGLAAVLADVRRAVKDWQAMRDRLAAVTEGMVARPPPVPPEETAAARDFLAWLAENHFTFLGYREYAYSGEGATARGDIVPGSGLGLLVDDEIRLFAGLRNLSALPAEVREFLMKPILVRVTKTSRRSTVHRAVPMDTIAVKRFDATGKVVGEQLFLGLFTSSAYSLSARAIPGVREKIDRVIARAGFDPNGHDGKALLHILETFPRDELFQIGESDLLATGLGILQLQERQRVALFVLRDPFERFVSCLVYVPRDRYTTALRLKFQAILEEAFGGRMATFSPTFSDASVLARVHFTIATTPGAVPHTDTAHLIDKLTDAARTYRDRLHGALIEALGEDRGITLLRRYADAFPSAYAERFSPAVAVEDIARIEAVASGANPLALCLSRPIEAEANELHFKVFRKGEPVPLSDVLPMLEHMGLRVITEVPYEIRPAGADMAVWMQDFVLVARDVAEVELSQVRAIFETAFARIWAGEAEDDGFNRLVLAAGLDWRQIGVLRAYCKHLRQINIPFSQAYMEETLARNGAIARLLIGLFEASLDPRRIGAAGAEADRVRLKVEITERLDAVVNLDEDRILRRYLNEIEATLRTNHYQADATGAPKPYLSLKLDSQAIDDLPLPRPWVEIFVSSPRMEGCHLRGGKVARGGIRWSDRREDFRTEILGLMKAQMVKNAVIVPVGSKGGFVVKRPPRTGGREALQAEVVACYGMLMRGLLDITDNRVGDKVVPPKDVVRRDGDDPYLVVAADKGTATFSDIANAISREYRFWLDDAFASGGSAGYDHKEMGITARGAWESVKRHFRELGLDTQSEDFTAVGVGDMSGDVFGNGMLRSPHTRLLAAFDHRHIFLDPAPDPAIAFKERARLFALPRSSWADYDSSLISAGGGVFERSLKSIKLSEEIRTVLGISAEAVTPAALIRAVLKAKVDLLWFGGIGTYVKASTESQGEAGDRGNDALRIDGRDVRARVIGEGANLAVTQRGRIEAARAGVRLNTDAIDNSAGVDTSDHEVNIKILLGDVVERGDMTVKQRDQLLVAMTEEVGELVLRDNYLQTQALSIGELEGAIALDRDWRLIRALEKAGRLNRAIEYLPDDEELARRMAAGEALTRPEQAVLLAYSKLWLNDELMASELTDDPHLEAELLRYFPRPLRKQYVDAIGRHRLRREIIATVVTNALINHMGPGYVVETAAKTGATHSDIARAYVAARQIFGLRRLWSEIEGLDGKVKATLQYRITRDGAHLAERASLWMLRNLARPLPIGRTADRFAPQAEALQCHLPEVLEPARAALFAQRVTALSGEAVPEALAVQVAALGDLTAVFDLTGIAERLGRPIDQSARVYFALGTRLAIDWLRHAVSQQAPRNDWQKLAYAAVVDDLNALQSEATAGALAGSAEPAAAIDRWIAPRAAALARVDALIAEIKSTPAIDIAALTVICRELRAAVLAPVAAAA